MNDNVIKLSEVKPKTVKHLYKKVPIKLMFIPKEHRWKWKITIVTETKYSEVSDSEVKALRAAQKYIDKHELGKD